MNVLKASLLSNITFSTMHYNTTADEQHRTTSLNHDINVVSQIINGYAEENITLRACCPLHMQKTVKYHHTHKDKCKNRILRSSNFRKFSEFAGIIYMKRCKRAIYLS